MTEVTLSEGGSQLYNGSTVRLLATADVHDISVDDLCLVPTQATVNKLDPNTVGLVLGTDSLLFDKGLYVDTLVVQASSTEPINLLITSCVPTKCSILKGDEIATLTFVPTANVTFKSQPEKQFVVESGDETDSEGGKKSISWNLTTEEI